MFIIKSKTTLCLSLLVSLTAFSSISAAEKGDMWSTMRQCAEHERKFIIGCAVDSKSTKDRSLAISALMAEQQPWHATTAVECLAIKRCLAMRADMKWHYQCTMGYDWPIWMASAVNIPVTSCAGLACNVGYPVLGAGIACCGFGIPCALKVCEQKLEKPKIYTQCSIGSAQMMYGKNS